MGPTVQSVSCSPAVVGISHCADPALEPNTVTIGVSGEDDDELRGILRDVLQRAGMTARPTVSGAEAVEIFTARPPDLLILDIGLPDADGRDVCQALRARGVTPLSCSSPRGLGDRAGERLQRRRRR